MLDKKESRLDKNKLNVEILDSKQMASIIGGTDNSRTFGDGHQSDQNSSSIDRTFGDGHDADQNLGSILG
jgi:hypothetical protein